MRWSRAVVFGSCCWQNGGLLCNPCPTKMSNAMRYVSRCWTDKILLTPVFNLDIFTIRSTIFAHLNKFLLDEKVSDDVSQLQSFNGYCRYGIDEKITTHSLDTTNDKDCAKNCNDAYGCTAFSYEYNKDGKQCILYRGGPYKNGDGRPNTKCYLMPKGISSDCHDAYVIFFRFGIKKKTILAKFLLRIQYHPFYDKFNFFC